MEKLNVPELSGIIWALKIKSALSLKRLDSVLSEVKPEGLNENDTTEWDQKNADAVAYIQLSLSDEQSLQFAAKENVKILREKIKTTFIGQIEDRKINAGNELKNLEMKVNVSANDYIAHARGLSTKCRSLGQEIFSKDLVYYTSWELKGKFSKIREILKTQREKSIDEILEILRQEEMARCSQRSHMEGVNAGVFYSRKNQRPNSNVKLCYTYRPPNHLSKDCCYWHNKSKTDVPNQRKEQRNF